MKRYRFTIVLLFALFICACSVNIYGQVGKIITVKEVSGISSEGDIYKVTGNVNLKGKVLEIPRGCVLDFKGGKIYNGTIVFNGNQLQGDICIDGEIQGTITNGELKAEWFCFKPGIKSDQTKKLQSMINLYSSNVSHNSWDINLLNPEPTIVIPPGKYNLGEIELRSFVTIKGAGRGSTELHGVVFKATSQYNFTVEDLSIVGDVPIKKTDDFDLENKKCRSAFQLSDCARLIFKNVCIRNYDMAFDNYNTYLVDLYSCFISYCYVGYLNDGKGSGYGGHAVRWFGGEIYQSKYGFVQKNGNGVLLTGATMENCEYAILFIYPVSFTVEACYFEANTYDIFGTVVHVNIENNFFSISGKPDYGAYIYAKKAIGYAVIQGNKFSMPISGKPHILVDEDSKIYGNIMIGQNDIMHGDRIPVSERLLPYIRENGTNTFQTYLPDGKKMLMGQIVVYKNTQTGLFYLVTRDNDGNLLFVPFSKEQ